MRQEVPNGGGLMKMCHTPFTEMFEQLMVLRFNLLKYFATFGVKLCSISLFFKVSVYDTYIFNDGGSSYQLNYSKKGNLPFPLLIFFFISFNKIIIVHSHKQLLSMQILEENRQTGLTQ